ncbi:MAG: nucleotide exchange factor GrpE [Pseudomonadota bacterium]
MIESEKKSTETAQPIEPEAEPRVEPTEAASEGEPHAPAGEETAASPDGADSPEFDELMAEIAAAAEEEGAATSEIAQLEEERDALKDKLMRALAEAENVRRRAERDRKDAETYGGTKLARDLLSVYDNIERALANADDALREDHAAFLEGVELTGRELLNAFAKHQIEKTTPEKGDRFDPNLHQAMFEAPVPGAEPGTIIEVMQPGFTIAGRLLRPALVGVARAS